MHSNLSLVDSSMQCTFCEMPMGLQNKIAKRQALLPLHWLRESHSNVNLSQQLTTLHFDLLVEIDDWNRQ